MKTHIKHFLSRQGLFTKLDLARRVPEIVRWLGRGSRGAAPPLLSAWF